MSVYFILQDITQVPKLKILSRADSGQYHEENPGQYNEKNPGQYEETDEGQYYEINPGQVNNHHIQGVSKKCTNHQWLAPFGPGKCFLVVSY